MGQADAGDNEAKLMTKLAPEWVRTRDPVIRSPARYRWTTAPACTNKNNITCITMATKYPIIKHRAFFKTLIAEYHPFILDGLL